MGDLRFLKGAAQTEDKATLFLENNLKILEAKIRQMQGLLVIKTPFVLISRAST